MNVLSGEEGMTAVRLARSAIERTLGAGGEAYRERALPPIFGEKRGVFVTLTMGGELRGCIGFPYPVLPLGEAVSEAAVSAATGDPRFSPVRREDLPSIRVEVTVLTVPEPVIGPADERPGKVMIGRHGLIVKGFGRSGLLLPQVATEYGWDAKTFLSHTCRKAGLPESCWKEQSLELFSFEGQVFHEVMSV